MRKLVWLLMLAVLVSCQDQPKVEQKQEPIENLPVKPPKVEKPFTVNDPEDWMKDAQPVHTVELDAFYMDVL